MLDVNCAWTLNEARIWAEALKDLRLKWLEEPVWPPENYDGLAQLWAGSIEGAANSASPNCAESGAALPA